MIRCEHCNCLCDPGDLIGGVCDDCREEELQKEEQKERMTKMFHAQYEQMKFHFE